MTYTVRALKQAAYNAGFRGHNLVIAVAVSLAENSARDERATNHNTNGTTDYGAWQINSVHNLPGNPFDLQTNANMAYTVYRAQGWRAWTVFKSGAYKPKLARAQRAKLSATGTSGDEHRPNLGGDGGTSPGLHAHAGNDPGLGDYLSAAGTAAGATWDDVLGIWVPGVPQLVNNVTNIDDLAHAIGDPALWRRIGLGALALLIVLIGVLVMLSSNKQVRSLEKVAAVL